ncbi:MAG TPA: ABC transporter substrate-binding protein, partial [Ardenticatenaceae bacterium]
MNQHKRINQLLATYRDLTEAEWREVETHVRTCAECAQTLAAYRAMDRELAELKTRDLATQATLQPNDRLRKAFGAAGSRPQPRWLRWMAGLPAFAQQVAGLAALLVLTAGLILVFQGSSARPGDDDVTVSPPPAVTTDVATPPPVLTPSSVPEAAEVAAPTEAVEAPAEKTMTICFASEPNTLLWNESALITQAVLEAVQEPAVEAREYSYIPNLVEKLPSFLDGDATLQEVTIAEGDTFLDADTDSVLTLTAGMTESFSLNQLEGEALYVEQWDGSPLTTVQQSAQWTFVEGLTWQDGTPVTSRDSVFAWEMARDPDYSGQDRYIAERTASYEALDEHTVRWTGLPGLSDPNYVINAWTPRPSHLYEGMMWAEITADEQANQAPLSYGPYTIDEWVLHQEIRLSPNPYHFRGAPPLDGVTIRFVDDTNQIIAMLASGECDMGLQDALFENSLPLVRGFEEQGLLRVEAVAGMTFEHLDFNLQPAEGYTGAAATLRDDQGSLLFQNVAFRRAIAHCMDREALIDQTTNGAAFVQHSYLTEEHPLYPGDEAISIYEFDPEAGRELLAGLGWEDTNGDGIVNDAAGTRLAFTIGTRQNPLREAVTQIVQAQLLEHCGIEVNTELLGSEFFADGPEGPVFGRNYDVAEFAWLSGPEPPCNLYISTQIPNEEHGWGASNNTG